MTVNTMQAGTTRSLTQRYREDGVVYLPKVLDAGMLELAREGFEWSRANPSSAAQHLFPGNDTLFYQDLFNTLSWPHYAPLLQQAQLGALMARLFGCENVWFFFEQIFLKAGVSRRTPWHQDTSYFPVDGADMSVMWISLDPVPLPQALEFVRGSHRGKLFDGSAFTGEDDTLPLRCRVCPISRPSAISSTFWRGRSSRATCSFFTRARCTAAGTPKRAASGARSRCGFSATTAISCSARA